MNSKNEKVIYIFPAFLFASNTNLFKRHFVALGFCCPHSTKHYAARCNLWLILESHPIYDPSSIWSITCLTCAHLKSTCTDRMNPQCSRWANAWKIPSMTQRYVYTNLKRKFQLIVIVIIIIIIIIIIIVIYMQKMEGAFVCVIN